MTNPPDQSDATGSQTEFQSEVFPGVPYDTKIAAELRDADGQVVSIGQVRFVPGYSGPNFYPFDDTDQSTLPTHAKILALNEQNLSLEVIGIVFCPQTVLGTEFHYHLSVVLENKVKS